MPVHQTETQKTTPSSAKKTGSVAKEGRNPRVVPEELLQFQGEPASEFSARTTLIMPDRAHGYHPFPLAQSPAPLAPEIVSPDTLLPQQPSHEPSMRGREEEIFVHDGVRYRTLPVAAQLAQAPRQTLLNWIKNKTEFQGRPLQGYYLAPVDRYFVSEESIQRMANRFVKWPSDKPTGPVTIGKTKDRSGFVSTSAAAKIIGVSPRTMWLWASQAGKAPTDQPIDVIKCTTSNHFYVRERDVYALKSLVPRSGLQRGRRPRLAPQP